MRCWLLALAVALAGAGNAIAADKLRFVTLEFAPFIFGKDQKVAGPGRDVIAAVCMHAAIDCTYDIYPWRRAQALMNSGRADGMMVIGRNPDREKWLRFSPPMFRTEYGFFVRAQNSLAFASSDQLAGYRVGVFAPSNTARTLSSIKASMQKNGVAPIEIDKHPDDSAGFRKLAAGRLNAVFSNRDRGRDIIRNEGLGGKIRYAGQFKALFYYAGITKAYPDQAVVDRFLASWKSLFESGNAQKIIRASGLEPAPTE
jgi:polar amino acid transport system substrate-binding protein